MTAAGGSERKIVKVASPGPEKKIIRPMDDRPDMSWPPKSKLKQWLRAIVRLIFPDPIIYGTKPDDSEKGNRQ